MAKEFGTQLRAWNKRDRHAREPSELNAYSVTNVPLLAFPPILDC